MARPTHFFKHLRAQRENNLYRKTVTARYRGDSISLVAAKVREQLGRHAPDGHNRNPPRARTPRMTDSTDGKLPPAPK